MGKKTGFCKQTIIINKIMLNGGTAV